jgi:ParB/RepB/Spo0J family partition protein
MSTFAELPLGLIQAAEDQPRKTFYEDSLDELAASIQERGVLEPIVVRPIVLANGDTRFEIVMGERRFRASHLAGKTHIPAIIRRLSDEDAAADALLENFQRENLNPIERARAIQSLLKMMPAEKVLRSLGISETTMRRSLELLELPFSIQEQLAAREGETLVSGFTESHARALMPLAERPELQTRLVEKIRKEKMSVALVDQAVRGIVQFPEKAEVFLKVTGNVSEQMLRSLGAREAKKKPFSSQTAQEQLKQLDKQITTLLDTVDVRIATYLNTDEMYRLLALLTQGADQIDDLANRVRKSIENADFGFREVYIHCPLCGRLELVGAKRCATCFTVLRRCVDCGHFDVKQGWCGEHGYTVQPEDANNPNEESHSFQCPDFQPRYVANSIKLPIHKAA